MVLKISSATTPVLRDQAFKVRHRVFVDEEGLLKATPDGRLFDRFDAYPTTNILAVTDGDEVVGSMRLSMDSGVGLQADEYYDFRKHLPRGSLCIHVGMFCMMAAYRSTGLAVGLMSTTADLALADRVTHAVAPINPRVGSLMRRLGFEAVGEEFVEPHSRAVMVPIVLDTEQLNAAHGEYADQHHARELFRNYERWFCKAGESICGDTAVGTGFVLVVEGLVRIQAPGSGRTALQLGPGAIFGGLTADSADIASGEAFAETDAQLIVWPTDRDQSGISENLFRVPHLANLFVERTQGMIFRLKAPES